MGEIVWEYKDADGSEAIILAERPEFNSYILQRLRVGIVDEEFYMTREELEGLYGVLSGMFGEGCKQADLEYIEPHTTVFGKIHDMKG